MTFLAGKAAVTPINKGFQEEPNGNALSGLNKGLQEEDLIQMHYLG